MASDIVSPQILAPNTLVHQRYRVVRQIGQGGMGAVYEAIDTRLGHTIALKQTLLGGAASNSAFEHEARLLAGLRHPTLPVVSDYFNEGGVQFLVMQFIPGDDLGILLIQRGGAFPVAEVMGWADQLLATLDYLHTQPQPIIHRDIKPQNLKLTPRGEIILLDFGLAKGAVGVTPAAAPERSIFGYTPQYAPPEQIQGSGTDARSDLYALAATLYTLLSGATPPHAPTRSVVAINGQPDPLRPVHELNPQVPAIIGAMLQRALALPADARFRSAAAMRKALQGAAVETAVLEPRPATGAAPAPPCPYPGMVPLGEADHARFFGRDREIQEMLERLRLHPFLAVIGASGSGKSSLIFAGLLPALRQTGLFGAGHWMVHALRPGAAPLQALAPPGSTATDPAQVVAELLATQPNARRLLVLVDQFEEMFTLGRGEATPFQHALLRLAATPGCYVVLTVRADFYPDLMASPLWPQIQVQRVEVAPLDAAGLRQVIVRPARGVGVEVEAALVERLVADAAGAPSILPLIQETLVLLWERLERRPGPLGDTFALPLSAYEALGSAGRTGIQVAIARRADAALASLAPTQQAITRRLFLDLVQLGEGRPDTRRQQPLTLLRRAGDRPADFDAALEHLTRSRLLTLSGEAANNERRTTGEPLPSSFVLGPSSAQVDLAHEALIAGWPTLRQWLEEDRADLLLHRRLAQAAGEWRSRGNDPSFLYGGSLLAEAQRYAAQHAQDLGQDELDFLGASVEREAARVRSRYLGQAAGGAIGAGLGYGLMTVLSSWLAHPGDLGVLPLAFLSMVPFGGLVGFGLGIGLWLGRSDQASRAVATALVGALLSGLVFPAYLLVATKGYFGPLDVAIGALIGVGVGLGAGLPTSARRRVLGTTLGGGLAAGLIVVIGGQLGTLLATIIGGPLVGLLTGLGILATAVEQDMFVP